MGRGRGKGHTEALGVELVGDPPERDAGAEERLREPREEDAADERPGHGAREHEVVVLPIRVQPLDSVSVSIRECADLGERVPADAVREDVVDGVEVEGLLDLRIRREGGVRADGRAERDVQREAHLVGSLCEFKQSVAQRTTWKRRTRLCLALFRLGADGFELFLGIFSRPAID